MARQHRRALRAQAGALVIAVVIAGCAGQDGSAPGAAQQGAPPGATTAGAGASEAASARSGEGASGNAGEGASASSDEPARAGEGASAGQGGSFGPPAAGDGGFASQLPPPDPNLTFDWEQTRPGAGECQPGRYSGSFSCQYAPSPDVAAIEVTGPVDLVLERSQNGEFLEIADGRLEGVAQLVFGFTAQLAGRLDCATDALQAEAVDGVYGFGDPSLLPFGMFAGELTGTLDRTLVALDGEWDLTVVGGGACVGPWTARLVP